MVKRTKEIIVSKNKPYEKRFKLQEPALDWYLNHGDDCRMATGFMRTVPYAQGFLENVVIEPKGFRVIDFTHPGEVIEFCNEVEKFCNRIDEVSEAQVSPES